EAHRIDDEYLFAAPQRQSADRGVERGEQLVLGQQMRARERVEQRGFPGVRVADERDGRYFGSSPFLAARFALSLGPLGATGQVANAPGHEATVGLELGFSRSTQTDAALLSLEVGPAADQTRRQMLVLSELDLELAFEGCCTLREDVEYKTVAVEDARLQRFF